MCKIRRNSVESEEWAKRVIHFYKNKANRDSKITWHLFKQEGIPKTNVYDYIKMFKDSDSVNCKKQGGHPAAL